MSDDRFDIEADEVPARYWRGLESYKSALSTFEPLAKHHGVGEIIAKWLLEHGLLESGQNNRYSAFGPCYRISDLGWQVVERGRWPRRERKA